MLPLFLAWDAFGTKNGTATYGELEKQITSYRRSYDPNPQIGCIILNAPFFFSPDEWIPVPEDWSPNIVQGKTYDESTTHGRALLDAVMERLATPVSEFVAEGAVADRRVVTTEVTRRLGQGGFRVLVTDAYQRRCAISEEKTLPVLDAAHIIPFSRDGSNSVSNGLLLRKDIHTLYDAGYITVTDSYHVEVSSSLGEDYGNGKIYYEYHGLLLPNIPVNREERPDIHALRWHNQEIYRS